MRVTFTLQWFALRVGFAVAWQYVSRDALPAESLSEPCVDALVVELSCPRQVGSFFERENIDEESLEEACSSACQASLADFEASLEKQCEKSDVFRFEEQSEPLHISYIGMDLHYNFNRTCIKDGNRWCHVWIQENAHMNAGDETASAGPEPTYMCDNCAIKPFQFQAGNPHSEGFDLQEDYSSLTERCSKTGFPLATTATGEAPSTTTSEVPSTTCTGTKYTVKAEDTCQSISEANDVATAWMLYDNGLEAFCSGFPSVGESICIVNQCKTHTIKADETCQGIASSNNITMVQLYTWNPVLGKACNRMSLSVGDTICLDPHGDENYKPPNHTTTIPNPPPTAVPIPSDIAANTTENCAHYYSVLPGDFCNKIMVKYSISLEDFLFLNQGVNSNCTNLFAEESYCVAPVGPINLYPGHPDYVSPTATKPEIPFNDLPKATFTPPVITGLPTHLPLAEGTRQDCIIYMDGPEIQIDNSWGFYESSCIQLADVWEITLDEMQNWNPSLNTSSPDCSPSEDYRYCLQAYHRKYTPPTVEDPATTTASDEPPKPTETALPIRDGAAKDCKEYYDVVPPKTCQDVLDDNNLTIAEFYDMNPAVGAECHNLWPNYRYCVKI